MNPEKPVTIVYGFALAVNPHIPEARQKVVHEVIRHVVKNPREWYEKTSYPWSEGRILAIAHAYEDATPELRSQRPPCA